MVSREGNGLTHHQELAEMLEKKSSSSEKARASCAGTICRSQTDEIDVISVSSFVSSCGCLYSLQSDVLSRVFTTMYVGNTQK